MMVGSIKRTLPFSLLLLMISVPAIFLAPLSFSAEKNVEKRYKNIPEEWKKGILLFENISPGEFPAFLPEEKLEKHIALYQKLKDPSLRLALASELGKSYSLATFRKIVLLLEKEQDSFCKSALLSSLLSLAENGYSDPSFASKCLTYLDLPNTQSKKCAAKLHFHLSTSPDVEKVLLKLNGRSEEYIMQDLFGLFAKHTANIGENVIHTFRQEKNSPRQNWGAAFALLKCDEKNIPDDLFKAALPGNPYSLRFYLAKASAYKKALPQTFFQGLFKDANTGLILAFLKEYAGNDVYDAAMEKEIQKFLASSHTSSIRLAAVEALQKGKSNISAEKVALLLLEKDPLIREQAVKSLVKMDPSSSVKDKIIQYAEKFPEARLDAVRFFAGIRDKKQDDKIILFLNETEKNKDHFIREKELQILAITLLGNGKVVESVPSIAAKRKSKESIIRRNVAESLGKIPSEKCLVFLEELLQDKEPSVALAAASSVVKILQRKVRSKENERMKKLYGKILCKHIAGRQMAFSDVRSASIYAVSLLDLTEQCRKDLQTLAEKECIIVPQSPRSLDMDHVRVSCLMALYEAGKKGNANCRKDFERLLQTLVTQADKDENISEIWKEYLRQIQQYGKGEKVSPSVIPPPKPVFTIYPL